MTRQTLNIDEYSVSAIPIQMFFDATELSVATAFIWEADQSHWLITNWHNVSGRNPITGKHLSSTAAEPNILRVWFNTRGQLGKKHAKDIAIRDESNKPLWLVHPKHRQLIDVIAIRIQNDSTIEMYAVNRLSTMDLRIQIGVDVFILGFPFGIGLAGLPTWKRGSIASEPELAGHTQLHFFIDAASRPGMSGSPVIRRSWGTHLLADGGTVVDGSAATKFVGIYSGRLMSSDPFDAQLGYTWPATVIAEIIAGGALDT